MSTRDLHDPELIPLLDALPEMAFSDAALPDIRAAMTALEPPSPPLPGGVTQREVFVPGLPGEPDIRALEFIPDGENRGRMLQLHGGGMVMGRPEQCAPKNAQLAATLGLHILAPAYRLAPEHTAPAALMDALACLLHLAKDASPARLIVSGDSAGGGLAFSTVSAAREHLSVPLALLHMVYPMLDPATGTTDCRANAKAGEFIWTRAHNRFGWSAYLEGGDAAAAHVPAAVDDLSGFPPVWIGTGSLDLFLDENLDMAKRLAARGVGVDMSVYPGAPHAFPLMAGAAVSRRFERDYAEALARAIERMN